MTVVALALVVLLLLVVWRWVRAERGVRYEADQHMEALRSESDVRRQRDEVERQLAEARAGIRTLGWQLDAERKRADRAEAIASQRSSELDGLRDEHAQALRGPGS